MFIETGQHQPKRYELRPQAYSLALTDQKRLMKSRAKVRQAEGHATLVTRPEMLSKHRIGGGERERLQGLFVYAGGIAVKPSIELSHTVDKGRRPFAVKGRGSPTGERVFPGKGGRPQIEQRCTLMLNLVKVELQERLPRALRVSTSKLFTCVAWLPRLS